MYDFHSHILPGIDDGPADIDESVAMATALHDAGFKTIYCTPHLMKGCFEADNQAVILAASTLQARLHKENIEMEILPGREYYLDEFLDGYLKDPLPLGKTKYIMIEIPNNATAEYVKENSSPSSQIAVLGSEPEIYFYAHRHPATGYIYTYSLMGRQKYTARMRQQMIQEIETCHPDLLVYVDDRDSWNYVDASAPQVVALLSWAQEYMQNQYERVGVVDIGESIQYVWGDAARTYRPRSDKAMYVLRRKVE